MGDLIVVIEGKDQRIKELEATLHHLLPDDPFIRATSTSLQFHNFCRWCNRPMQVGHTTTCAWIAGRKLLGRE